MCTWISKEHFDFEKEFKAKRHEIWLKAYLESQQGVMLNVPKYERLDIDEIKLKGNSFSSLESAIKFVKDNQPNKSE